MYDVVRLEKSAYEDGPAAAKKYLKPEKMVPADDRIKAIATSIEFSGFHVRTIWVIATTKMTTTSGFIGKDGQGSGEIRITIQSGKVSFQEEIQLF